ncbi:MAG: hypothetical protein EAZ63_07170 [Runella slithyformis]|nr:MAG: hypothetical protein EAZ63_07170 [Runella slithyformis]
MRDKIGERSYQEAYLKAIPFTFFTSCPDFVTHDDAAYQRINDYIETNVLAWKKDMFFKKEDQ